MSDTKNHEFVIKFEGVHLSAEAIERIQLKIDDLLLEELGGLNAGGSANDGDDYCGIYIPRKWIGRQVINLTAAKLESLVNPAIGNIGAVVKTQGF